MALPMLPTDQVVLKEGDIAPEDIIAPRSVTYESSILRAQAEEQAANEVEPIYTVPDPAWARQQRDRAQQVLDYLGSVRADALASPVRKKGWILAVTELADLAPDVLDDFLLLSDAGWDKVQLETSTIIDQAMRREIRDGHLEEAHEMVPAMVSFDLSDEEATVTIALVRRFLVANSFLDLEATEEAQEQARKEVGPAPRVLKAGETIVRRGDRVTVLHIEALEQLGLQQPEEARWTDFIGVGLLAIVGTLMLYLYLGYFQPDVLWAGQELLLLVLLIACFAVGAGLMVPSGAILRYLFPAPALAMLVTASLGPHAGVAAALLLSCVAGVTVDNSLEMTTYTALGGLAATLTMGRVEHIGALFRAGAFAALVQTTIALTFHFPQDATQPSAVIVPALAGVVGGGISASLALGLLFLIGPLFDIATTMRLIELSRPDHPLLQRLLRESPATYHHSLMVANLAEQAAERIGANPLLTRVGAYYHDVGKIVRPYFFAENQVESLNPHDRLDPLTSANVIISHINDGLSLARRYRLPRRVRAFIPEHHGTNRASFLYRKAVQLAGDEKLVDENDFRYPGPKPQNKETALVMLADGCEAAVRASRPTSAEEVASTVNRVISKRVDDLQLSECNLTLRDLEIVRETFISALKGVYHPRIQYPRSEGGTQDVS